MSDSQVPVKETPSPKASDVEHSLEEVNKVQRKLNVALGEPTVGKAFREVLANIRKKAQIKGFRKGKAPEAMLRKIYGQNIAADVADKLIRDHLFSAIEAQGLRPVGSPSLTDVTLPKEGESYKFSAIIDIMPEIELPDFKSLTATAPKVEVKEEDLENQLLEVRRRHAKRKTKEESEGVKDGDAVVITQTAHGPEGEKYLSMEFSGKEVEVGKDFLPEETKSQLLGMKIGESKHYHYKVPADAPSEDMRGIELHVDLKVDGLNEIILPALDDELAKDESFENLQEMKEFFRKSIEFEAKRYRQSTAENAALEALSEKVDLEVPPYFTDQVIDQMIDGMRIPPKEVAKIKADKELRNSLLPNAKVRAKNTLLLWEVVKKFDLKIEDEDIERKIDDILPPSKTEADTDEIKNSLRATLKSRENDSLLIEKALRILAKEVEINWTSSVS